jgi:hypothetical protein
MADGSERAVEDVRPDDCVVTADGRTGVVRQTITRSENDSVVRLILSGHTSVYLAPHHIVLTKHGDVAVRDLMLDDWVALTRFLPTARDALITGEVIPPRERARTSAALQADVVGLDPNVVAIPPIPDAVPLTPITGRLFGLFLAYGSSDASKVRWTFVGQDRDALVNECAHLLRNFGLGAEIQPQLNSRVSVIVYAAPWARLWTRLFGPRDDERTLHPALFGDADFLRAMLGGWVAGEGYAGRNIADRWQQMRGSTVSRTLAMSLYDIALGLGFRPTVRWCAPSENLHPNRSRPFYEVELITPSDNPDSGGDTDQAADEQRVVNAVHAWSRVRGVEQRRYSGTVYSLDVDGDESYVAEGIGVRCPVTRGAAIAQNG